MPQSEYLDNFNFFLAYMRVQESTGEYRSVQESARECRRVQENTGSTENYTREQESKKVPSEQ